MKLSQTEARAFTNFRRTSDAIRVKEVLVRELTTARENFETTTASEFHRQKVLAIRDVMTALFDAPLELKK